MSALDAGHEERGAELGAAHSCHIGTCKLNRIEPFAYRNTAIDAIAVRHAYADIDLLLPSGPVA
jgi:transposase